MLRTSTLRILYPKGVSKAEVDIAQQGITKQFNRFGVVCETAQVGGWHWNSKPARSVYIGERLADLVNCDAPAARISDLSAETLMGALRFRDKSVYGLGITDRPLARIQDIGSAIYPVIGIASCGGGGIMSISGLRELNEQEKERAIEVAAAHMAGRVVGYREDCKNTGCIMGQSKNTDDFVQRFVRESRDFCDHCAHMIRIYLGALESKSA